MSKPQTTIPPAVRQAIDPDRKMFNDLVALAEDLLHPEQLGWAATAEIRDRARLCLGIPACESHLKART
jgi:hypothetical protein